MKIGVMSDSHGRIDYIDKAVELAGKVDMWLFLGDVRSDSDYLEATGEVPVVAVLGNNDWTRGNLKDEELLTVEDVTIFLSHGHYLGVRTGTEIFAKYAREQGATVGLYGHSHIADKHMEHGVLVLNPGSVALPRDARDPSFLLLEVAGGEVLGAEHVFFELD